MAGWSCADCGTVFRRLRQLRAHSIEAHGAPAELSQAMYDVIAAASWLRGARARMRRHARYEALLVAQQAKFWRGPRTAEQMDDHQRPVDTRAVRELFPRKEA